MPLNLEGWMRVSEAAAVLGVTPRHVRLLIARGALRAERIAPRLYLVEHASVEDYKQTRRPPGRPPRQEEG